MFACVRAEAAGALSIADPLGAVPAPIADLTVDLRLVGCHRGAVESLSAGHCRGKEGQKGGVEVPPPIPVPLMPCRGQETQHEGPSGQEHSFDS